MHRFLVAILLAVISLNANALSILLTGEHEGRDPAARLVSLGHTVTSAGTTSWAYDVNFDYSAYDVVVFAYDANNPADIGRFVATVEAGEVGAVFFRGSNAEPTALALGILGSGTLDWQYAYSNLNVVDNSHYITQGIDLGIHALGYTYMSYVPAPGADTSVLAIGLDGAALVVHNNLRVAVTPFYGHLDGFDDETAFGLELTERTLQWAAGASTELEITPVEIDIRPSTSVNKVRPTSTGTINVAVLSTSVADGDIGDFDATQVDASTLKFGIGEAPNVTNPRVRDVDGDSDNDVTFGFRIQESGIACGDTEATLTGATYIAEPFTGADSVVTIDCVNNCHP